MALTLFFVVWLVCGVIAGIVAAGKGRSGVGGLLLGFVLGPIGLAVVLLLADTPERAAERAAGTIDRKAGMQTHGLLLIALALILAAVLFA
jgi:hypothetical protein